MHYNGRHAYTHLGLFREIYIRWSTVSKLAPYTLRAKNFCLLTCLETHQSINFPMEGLSLKYFTVGQAQFELFYVFT